MISERLWPYLSGIARTHEMKALVIGGVEDHEHLLLSLPPTLAVSSSMQLIKGNSSKWLRETFPELRADEIAWQEGFGAFVLLYKHRWDIGKILHQLKSKLHERKSWAAPWQPSKAMRFSNASPTTSCCHSKGA